MKELSKAHSLFDLSVIVTLGLAESFAEKCMSQARRAALGNGKTCSYVGVVPFPEKHASAVLRIFVGQDQY